MEVMCCEETWVQAAREASRRWAIAVGSRRAGEELVKSSPTSLRRAVEEAALPGRAGPFTVLAIDAIAVAIVVVIPLLVAVVEPARTRTENGARRRGTGAAA